MEALIVLILELILEPLFALVVLLLEGIVAVGGMLLEFIFSRKKKRSAQLEKSAAPETSEAVEPPVEPIETFEPTEPIESTESIESNESKESWSDSPGVKPKKTWHRRLVQLSLFMFIISCVSLFVMDRFFFGTAVDFILQRVKERKNIEITYSVAEGSLFTGELRLRDAVIKRTGSEKSNYNIEVEDFFLDLDMPGLLSSRRKIETLRLENVTGRFDRVAKRSSLKKRTPYVIAGFSAANVDVMYSDAARGKPVSLHLKLNRVESKQFRSDYAVLDILFNSDITGTVDNQPVEIRTQGSGENRLTTWKVVDFPMKIAAGFIGGPLKYVSAGNTDIYVNNTWRTNDNVEIDMEWKLMLNDLEIKDTENLGSVSKKMAAPVIRYLEKHGEKFQLTFHMTIEEKNFRYLLSFRTEKLWKRAGKVMMLELGKRGSKKELIKAVGKKGISTFKKYLKKRKEKKNKKKIEE